MTDIIKPELIWIEGRCYRVNDPTTEISALQEHDLYENETTFDDQGDEDDDDFEVTMIDNNRYCTMLHVSKHYIGSIIGKKGAMKNRIERDTKTEIKIPRQGQTGDVSIFGPAPSNVKAGRRRINIIVMSSRMKQRATHFISIPMNSVDIIKNFDNFKDSVLKDCPNSSIDESFFIRPEKLHLTLGVMCLMDNEERLHASKLLTEAKEKIIIPLLQGTTLPLNIRLKGLSYMNDDPTQINVLYGLVEEENASPGLLQQLGDQLVDYFHKAGFVDKWEHGRDNLKLHVTLLNSKYRRRAHTSDADKSTPRRPLEAFDGSEVLRKFADHDFGVAELREIHLSQRQTMGPDGYYQPTCIIACDKGHYQ